MKLLRGSVVLVILMSVLAFASAMPAMAEDPQKAGLELRQLQGVLHLSVGQVARMAPIIKTYREQYRARLASFRSQLCALLSPEQAQKFDAMRKQYRRGHGQGRGLKGLQAELGLSQDQVDRIGVLRQAVREQAKADYGAFVGQVKTVLTPEQFERFQEVTQRNREGEDH